jgi:hypothetical protein
MKPLLAVAVLLGLAAPHPALAQVESRCSAAKLKAAGAYLAALAKSASRTSRRETAS